MKISKDFLVQLYKKEFATTLKVMKAYPDDKHDFKPHERSQEALRLMSTFVFEMYLNDSYVFGEKIGPEQFQNYKPESIAAVMADFEKQMNLIIGKIEAMSDEDLNREVNFANVYTTTADQFLLMMLCDQIHHRGQLSVYVRMAGGKVPSIYGPSADDPTPNL